MNINTYLGSGPHTKNFKVLLKFCHKETSFMGVKFSLQYTQQSYSKYAEPLVFYNIQKTKHRTVQYIKNKFHEYKYIKQHI
jgi:hypothetical protein